MATYNLKLSSVNARADGNVQLDMWVLTTSLHKSVLVPYTALAAALSLPTTGEKATAIKAAIWDSRNNKTPIVENTSEWSFELLEAAVGSINQAAALTTFINDDLGQSLPFEFAITG